MLNLKENEVITLNTEDGDTVDLEYMASVDYEGCTYGAFYPVLEDEEDVLDADYDMLILKATLVGEETMFDLVDDEKTEEALEDIFLRMIFGYEE